MTGQLKRGVEAGDVERGGEDRAGRSGGRVCRLSQERHDLGEVSDRSAMLSVDIIAGSWSSGISEFVNTTCSSAQCRHLDDDSVDDSRQPRGRRFSSAIVAYGLYEVESLSTGELAFGPWIKPGDKLILADKLAESVDAKSAKASTWKKVAIGKFSVTVAAWHRSVLFKTSASRSVLGGYSFPVPHARLATHVTDDTGTGFVHTAPATARRRLRRIWMEPGGAKQLAAQGHRRRRSRSPSTTFMAVLHQGRAGLRGSGDHRAGKVIEATMAGRAMPTRRSSTSADRAQRQCSLRAAGFKHLQLSAFAGGRRSR